MESNHMKRCLFSHQENTHEKYNVRLLYVKIAEMKSSLLDNIHYVKDQKCVP